MKKASRVLTILLVVVMLSGLFCGCGVLGRNSEKYRSAVVFNVGNETISVGRLIDTFNNYYNNYSYYVSNGAITVDYIFQMAVSSLYAQYMKVDAYKTAVGAAPYTHTGTDFANQGYLTVDELQFVIKYVKYSLFSALDGVVEGYIRAEYELNAEEDDDTSRDFYEYDDLGDATSYSQYLYAQNFSGEEIDEYVDKYYDGIMKLDNLDIDEYVYSSEAAAKSRLDNLNGRLEEGTLTYAQLKDWQEKAIALYKKNVQSTYNYGIEKLLKTQVEDFIISIIVAKYNYSIYSKIDGADKEETIKDLKAVYEDLTANQVAGFNVNKNFVSFVESLSDSSFLYGIPAGYNYVYVKNILIPFDSTQKTILSNLEKQLGTKDDANGLYKAKLVELASQVVAEDFNGEKDGDGNYPKVENVFAVEGGKLVVNPAGELGAYLNAAGQVVAAEGKTAEQTIVDLMARFNTDTAQHKTLFDYVVRVGQTPESYSAQWVTEFVDATNDAVFAALGWTVGEGGTYATRDAALAAVTPSVLKTTNGGTYALAISTYGVHIVYFSGLVEAQSFDFDNELLDTTTPAYRMYKSFFSTLSNKLTTEDTSALQKTYFKDKISKTKELDKFLKNNGLTFDFEDSISLEDKD